MKVEKVIYVCGCFECPYRKYVVKEYMSFCRKLARFIDTDKLVPDWCNLDNYKTVMQGIYK